jgi:predicted nuclease of restriction endonuclease-like (RecB) superfamily
MGTKKVKRQAPGKAAVLKATKPTKRKPTKRIAPYGRVLREFAQLVEGARHASARAVNALMTGSYWEIGRRIVHHEQGGEHRAGYGEELITRLSFDLSERFGRGFSKRNIEQMRAFYIMWPIAQTVSAQLEDGGSSGKQGTGRGRKTQTVSAQLKKNSSVDVRAQQIAHLHAVSEAFPLPWSHYVRLLTVDDDKARAFYEREALRNGWTVRQLDRQVATRFYERTGLSRNKTRMLSKGAKAEVDDAESAIRDPFVLEFLDLKDEYNENELEEALIQHLEHFLLELGGEFAFVARQRNVRIGKQWYRVDLLFFHRRLRCLVVIDLKVGRYTHADAGQMNLYLNYAQEHWMTEEENPPVGLVLCTERDDAVAHYSLNGLTNRVMAREYRITLPKEKKLEQAIEKALRTIERRKGR